MSPVMKLLSLAIGALMLVVPSHAEVTKWIDAQGRVHYSERPPTGTSQILLPCAERYRWATVFQWYQRVLHPQLGNP